MSQQSTPLKALETASQLHENETVIELGADRFIHFISVRLIIILAIVAKVTEVLNGNLSCHPVKNETGFDKNFIKFANAYCWESPVIKVDYSNSESLTKKKCELEATFGGKKLLEHPEVAINLLRWMPYALLLEAFLFSLPSAWWHFRVGGRLLGHLKFIQLFLAKICSGLKDLPAGLVIEKKAYDKKSHHLDGWCEMEEDRTVKFVKEDVDEHDPKLGDYIAKTMRKVRGEELEEYFKESSDDSKHCDNNDDENILEGYRFRKKSKNGEMLDRHLFSNLCYENFSSLEYFPYLLSIIRLTYCAKFKDQEGVFPLNQGILRQWCHEKNFSGRFLVHKYYIKHAFGIIIALGMLRTVAFFLELLGREIWILDSFRCDVIFYEDVFVVCTFHRKAELVAFLLLNLIIITTFLVFSVWQVYFISHARHRESSSFFEYANDTGSIGLLAALREKQKSGADKEKKRKCWKKKEVA